MRGPERRGLRFVAFLVVVVAVAVAVVAVSVAVDVTVDVAAAAAVVVVAVVVVVVVAAAAVVVDTVAAVVAFALQQPNRPRLFRRCGNKVFFGFHFLDSLPLLPPADNRAPLVIVITIGVGLLVGHLHPLHLGRECTAEAPRRKL